MKHIPNRHTVYQLSPASPLTERWRDASPLGNGLLGALVFGSVGIEEIVLTRGDLWQGGGDDTSRGIPDCGDILGDMRALMDEGRYAESNRLLWDRLSANGYGYGIACPAPLGEVTLTFGYDGLSTGYRRALHLDTAESEVTYTVGRIAVSRRFFASRADGRLWGRIEASGPIDLTAGIGFYHAGTPASEAVRGLAGESTPAGYPGTVLYTRPDGRGNTWSAVMRVIPDDTEAPQAAGGSVTLKGVTGVTIIVETLRETETQTAAMTAAALQAVPADYEAARSAHVRLHGALYGCADVRLYDSAPHSNEALLAEAYDGTVSPELTEKLWRMGRYLFICATSEGGLPFPLYGLWAGDYDLMWSQYTANENVQMCAWLASVGGLAGLLKPLIDYYFDKMPAFRENAALFGCRGIVASVYTSPYNSYLAPSVPVILHFTTTAGWLCRHFFEYADMTGDEETLREKILPFAVETALFIEDYAVIKDGRMRWYPSVSPENTPFEYRNSENPMWHDMPTTENATMELAIIKELLTTLIRVCSARGLYTDKLPVWQRLLDAVPPYEVNPDGAVREWQSPAFTDNYEHRHLSHIYPLFPGDEIGREHPLFPAFERAVDLRVLGASSGWSQMHMAAIYARLGRGERAADCLDVLAKTCLLPNLFTVHNDWRESGMTLRMGHPPVQLDASLGASNAVQMMLLDVSGGVVRILPALPTRLKKGSARGLCCPCGSVDIRWDTGKRSVYVRLHPVKDGELKLGLPFVGTEYAPAVIPVQVHKGKTATFRYCPE
ncbi:MAG: glycoside hydrolase family 95 protein [Clostridia bacterium]|nr:glycoside hydrolase family 95 protein [Clostridia bacterium]